MTTTATIPPEALASFDALQAALERWATSGQPAERFSAELSVAVAREAHRYDLMRAARAAAERAIFRSAVPIPRDIATVRAEYERAKADLDPTYIWATDLDAYLRGQAAADRLAALCDELDALEGNSHA
jgi:hypothetical protein